MGSSTRTRLFCRPAAQSAQEQAAAAMLRVMVVSILMFAYTSTCRRFDLAGIVNQPFVGATQTAEAASLEDSSVFPGSAQHQDGESTSRGKNLSASKVRHLLENSDEMMTAMDNMKYAIEVARQKNLAKQKALDVISRGAYNIHPKAQIGSKVRPLYQLKATDSLPDDMCHPMDKFPQLKTLLNRN
jgi:predicted RNA-binding protein with PUA-like domain